MTEGWIFDIRRLSVHDGPGIRTTVFFKGCPLQCWWCHNPESRNPGPESSVRHLRPDGRTVSMEETTGRLMSVAEVVDQVQRDRPFFEESGGGVTLSGGEPMFQPEFLTELYSALKAEGIHVALDTCGYAPWEHFQAILPHTDLILFDLKHYDEAEHLRYTGVHQDPVTGNLERLIAAGAKLILRLPVIPGINDDAKRIAAFLTRILDPVHLPPIHLLPYHSMAKNKYHRMGLGNRLDGQTDMTRQQAIGLREQLVNEGFSVRIGG